MLQCEEEEIEDRLPVYRYAYGISSYCCKHHCMVPIVFFASVRAQNNMHMEES